MSGRPGSVRRAGRQVRGICARVPAHGAQPQGTHRILFPVRMRIHCGIGRFCLSFLASVFLVRSVLWAGCAHVAHAGTLESARGGARLAGLCGRRLLARSRAPSDRRDRRARPLGPRGLRAASAEPTCGGTHAAVASGREPRWFGAKVRAGAARHAVSQPKSTRRTATKNTLEKNRLFPQRSSNQRATPPAW